MRFPCLGAFACLLACACAREPAPSVRGPSAATPRAPAPFPDTAFQSDAGSPPGTSRPRFETQRIGGDQEGGEQRYRGAPVDMDVKNADLADLFRLLADVGHVSIVVSDEVKGTLTLRLKHVPWEQALEVIATIKHLGVERTGSVVTVTALRRP